MDARATTAVPAGYIDARRIAGDVVPAGWWRRLVFSAGRPDGTVDRAAYVFCVLEQFHRHLLRRDIYASPSARWADPRAKLLTAAAWDAARGPALNALGLPEDPGELLAEHYLDHAIEQLRADGYPVLDADVARLSPYMRRHINFHGHYSFAATNLGGARRAATRPRRLRRPTPPTPDAPSGSSRRGIGLRDGLSLERHSLRHR